MSQILQNTIFTKALRSSRFIWVLALLAFFTFGDTLATERINASLIVGSSAENVIVSAGDLPLLQTDKAELDYTLSTQQVKELPTSSTAGRNIGSLYQLVPGSTPPAENNSMASNPQRSMTVNVNGLNGTANTTRIDGAIDTYPSPPLDGSAYVPPQ